MTPQTVTINFAKGLDLKSDPWQVAAGNFLALQNSIFQKGGLLQKRNGYGQLAASTPPSSYLTTLNGNLVSIGSTVNAYSSTLRTWITKGQLEPCSLSVLPLIRNNLNQIQSDSVVANGLVLTAYTQIDAGTKEYVYVIADAVTGQNVVAPSLLPVLAGGVISGSSRVFLVGSYFVIVSQVLVSSTTFLQYVSIPIANPGNLSAAQNVRAEAYAPISSNPGWDGVVSNNTLVVAYNTTAGGQGVHVTSLTEAQIATNSASAVVHAFTGATFVGAIISVCVDLTSNPNIFYISFWNNSTMNTYTAAVYIGLGTITTQFTPQLIVGGAVANLASAAQRGSALILIEVPNAYSYDSGVPTNYISAAPISSSGVVGASYVMVRSLGLGSKGFIVDGTMYFLGAFQSPFQPTYFLINASLSVSANPIIVAKLAYQNGGGYVTLGLPSVAVSGDVAQISYLFKDLVQALTTLNTSQQQSTGGVYSQTGINLVSFTLGTEAIDTAELAGTLNISGGYLSMFDGYLPVEQNFFVWPDSVELVASTTGGAMTAQQYFYQVTYEWSDNQGNIHRSTPSVGVAVTTTGSTSSVTVNIPTLRLTAKIANPVKIVIYRWSTANQTYQQVTSITAPLLNNTSIDEVAFVDTLADSAIIGNNIIYTTGGVVPDTNAPSFHISTLFDTRLWVVDDEDPNLLWLSKQVIEDTPVEMSADFTIYVAPNTGTVASTGPISALAPMDDKLIIWKKEGIFYINGTGPNNLGTTSVGCPLGNYSQPTFITAVVGCTNQNSIVLTADGLMFQSDKGIWLLGRDLSTTYIGSPVESFNASTVNSANIIPETNYVLFTLSTGQMLMYDYFYKQWGTFVGSPAISSCIYNGLHTLLTPYGEILQATPNAYLDNQNPVLMSFTTSWLTLAGLQGYERFYEFYLLAKYLSPHKMIVDVAYNYNPSPLNQKIISPQNFSPSTPGPFGAPTPFGSPGDKEQWRVHTKQQLCESFQVTVTEVFDASMGTVAGAGFTMSGLLCEVGLKSDKRPISGGTSVGVS